MQNPLEALTYRVGNEIYRRNCPFEMASTANPAAAAEYTGDEQAIEEQEEEQCIAEGELITVSESRKEKREMVNTLDMTEAGRPNVEGAIEALASARHKLKHTVNTVSEEGTVFTERKEQIELLGTVKYDQKEQIYFDSINVVSALIGLLKGREGHKQKKMEANFQCLIHFPRKRHSQVAEIRITSTISAHQVLGCKEAMEKALIDARKQAIPTHFVSIPILDAKLREEYSELVKQICEDDSLEKVAKNPDIFMAPPKLHITLSVLKLFTSEEVDRVKHFLDALFTSEQIKETFAEGGKIRLEFPALEHFADRSPEKVTVLFAKVVSARMQMLANAVDDALTEAALAEKRKMGDVVLHMTVLNTKYQWEVGQSESNRGSAKSLLQKKRSFIDASTLLDKFGQLRFSPVEVDELHLCEMRGTGDDSNGYKSVHAIKFAN